MAKKKTKLKWIKNSKTHYSCRPIFMEPSQLQATEHRFDILFKDWGERKLWILIYDNKNLYFHELSDAKKVAQLIANG